MGFTGGAEEKSPAQIGSRTIQGMVSLFRYNREPEKESEGWYLFEQTKEGPAQKNQGEGVEAEIVGETYQIAIET